MNDSERDAQLEELGQVFVVSVYDTWRSYGGPEEGGWWYTEGELTGLAGAFSTEGAAVEAADDLRSDLELTKGRGTYNVSVVALPRWDVIPILRGQMCHFDGDLDDRDYVLRWDIPEGFPEGRPHYC